MGMEKENKVRLKDFRNFQINSKIMDNTNKKSVFMHCLPAHIDEEVTEEVINSKKSLFISKLKINCTLRCLSLTMF